MKGPRPLNVVFFKTDAGNEPVREWLKALPKDERYMIGEDIKKVQWGWPLGMPLVRPMGDGLHEIRSRLSNRIARVFFTVWEEKIVLLHGFIKKDQQTPVVELRLAKKRKDVL
jgi:phage-related protein